VGTLERLATSYSCSHPEDNVKFKIVHCVLNYSDKNTLISDDCFNSYNCKYVSDTKGWAYKNIPQIAKG